MSSNLRLLLIGLVVGGMSVFYPRLPQYLPPQLAPYVPFTTHHVNIPESAAWAGYQRYQSGVPVAANHDPFDDYGPQEEKLRRLYSKDGEKEMEKMIAKERKALEGRTESAGVENKLNEVLPVYFLSEAEAPAWSKLGSELTAIVKPETVIFLSTLSTSFNSLTVSSSPLSQPVILALAHEGVVGHASSNPTESTESVHANTLRKRLETRGVAVLDVGVPPSWEHDQLFKVAKGLHRLREGNVVIIGVGTWWRNQVPKEALHDALVAHTSHPREVSLERIDGVPHALLAAAGAAGEGEGESLDGGRGLSWRFGHLPLTKDKKKPKKKKTQ